MAGINWRESSIIDEENRYGSQRNPDRVTAVMTIPCAGGCGEPITEVHFADGHRSYVEFGVCTGMGQVWHRTCRPPTE
jgi:hypothetical protein